MRPVIRPVLASTILTIVSLIGGLIGSGQVQSPGGQKAPRERALEATEIAEARQRLAELGYWIDPAADLRHESFRHALIAFQKVEGRPRTGRLTIAELEALRNGKAPTALEAGELHVEVDLQRQILLVVESGGKAGRILPISSGSNKCFTEGGRTRRAVTPLGRFKVIRKIDGWRKSPLGRLYYPLYFHNGTAIHGNPAVPTFPASHGCIRVPMFAAVEFSKLIPIGTPVLIHHPDPGPAPGPCPKPASPPPSVAPVNPSPVSTGSPPGSG